MGIARRAGVCVRCAGDSLREQACAVVQVAVADMHVEVCGWCVDSLDCTVTGGGPARGRLVGTQASCAS